MNLYKRFSNFLLENYPLFWHTKFIQLFLGGILIWLASFYTGYSLIDLNTLNQESISDYYFSSLFVLFHSIISLILLSFWGIYFYRNNPFKNFYPLQRFYFTKVFFQLFIPFSLIVSAYFPFTWGAISKTKTFYQKEQLITDIDKLNIGYPFLISSINPYDLENRQYPSPYPLDKKKISSPIQHDLYLYNQDTPYNAAEIEGYDVAIDGVSYQFFKKYRAKEIERPCEKVSIISHLYKENQLDAPKNNELINFSELLINPSNLKENQLKNFNLYYWEGNSNNEQKYYRNKYAQSVYELVRKKRFMAIQSNLETFKQTCQKYGVAIDINPKHIVQYLRFKQFQSFRKTITNTSKDTYSFYNREDEINQIESVLKRKKLVIQYMEAQHTYFYDAEGLHKVFNNIFYAEYKSLFNSLTLIPLTISLFLTWLLLCFEFTSIKHFLISLPISGVLVLLVALSSFFLEHKLFDDSSKTLLLLCILMITLVKVFYLISIHTSFISKNISSILLNLLYFATPYALIFVLAFIRTFLPNEYKTNACGDTHLVRSYEWLNNGYVLYSCSLLSILAFYSLLRKWKAKAE